MSRLSQGFLAVLAAALVFGAVHLEVASGSDLKALTRGDASLTGTRGTAPQQAVIAVNRATKSDRLGVATAAASGPTIVFTVPGLRNTSVATFLPAPPGPSSSLGSEPKPVLGTAACEPPVSALTEVARLMVTGRCVT